MVPRPSPSFELLETRRMFSIAAGVSGAPLAIADSAYVLNLYGTPLANQWMINWGDGTDPEKFSPTTTQAFHVYTNEIPGLEIKAFLLEVGEDIYDLPNLQPANVALDVVHSAFGVHTEDEILPPVEGATSGLFLDDLDAMLAFQAAKASIGDSYRILWGDGTASNDYVLVDDDNDNVPDPVQWLTSDLLALHDYATTDAVSAVFQLTTQNQIYYSNAVLIQLQRPIDIEITGGDDLTQDVTITVTRNAALGDAIDENVYVFFQIDAASGISYTVTGDGSVSAGVLAITIPYNETSASVTLEGIDPEAGGVLVEYLGWELVPYFADNIKSVRASANIWLMHQSGLITQIDSPSASDLLDALSDALSTSDPIIDLSITGHGSCSWMGVGSDATMYVDTGAIMLEGDGLTTPLDITDLLDDALASNAQLNLFGPETGLDAGSLATQVEGILTGRAVCGTGSTAMMWGDNTGRASALQQTAVLSAVWTNATTGKRINSVNLSVSAAGFPATMTVRVRLFKGSPLGNVTADVSSSDTGNATVSVTSVNTDDRGFATFTVTAVAATGYDDDEYISITCGGETVKIHLVVAP